MVSVVEQSVVGLVVVVGDGDGDDGGDGGGVDVSPVDISVEADVYSVEPVSFEGAWVTVLLSAVDIKGLNKVRSRMALVIMLTVKRHKTALRKKAEC